MKYTDEQIKKSLECCRDNEREHSCRHCKECFCSYCDLEENESDCYDVLLNRTLDLINRQEAESERLNIELQAMRGAANSYKAEVQRLRAKTEKRTQEKLELGRIYTQKLATTKSEAIKEFAERLKAEIAQSTHLLGVFADIDNLVKEMVGEGE